MRICRGQPIRLVPGRVHEPLPASASPDRRLSASYYPTDCRATGVSWANGVGLFGSAVGSVGGATMLWMGLTMPALFVPVGIPAVVAGATMLSLGLVRRGSRAHELAAG